MIWEPFVLALFLGLIVSAGLYFAYLWPQVEPQEGEPAIVLGDSLPTDAAPEIDAPKADAAPAPAPDAEDDAKAEPSAPS